MIEGACHCGAVRWTFDGDPVRDTVTTCNCSWCRRTGGLWVYDYEGERITLAGPTAAYVRTDMDDPAFLENLFCPVCAGVVAWRALAPDAEGRRRMAVNVRHADPAAIGDFALRHFDGLDRFEALPVTGQCVRDLLF